MQLRHVCLLEGTSIFLFLAFGSTIGRVELCQKLVRLVSSIRSLLSPKAGDERSCASCHTGISAKFMICASIWKLL